MQPAGMWYNELGSQMSLNVSGNNVWGSYYTGVGHAIGTYNLSGQINPVPFPSPYGQALAWTVAWTNAYANAHSATAWSGEFQTIGGDDEIVALWLLANETTPNNDWQSTLVGKDVFTRFKPSPEQIEANRRRVAASHPEIAPAE